MRISASISTGLGLDRRAHTPAPAHGVESPVRTNLPAVIETPALRRQASPQGRPLAALVAQLVAHAEDMPETRARRRADAGYGTNVYQSVAELGPRPDTHTARVI
jgi:hypothetical protein